MSGSRRRQTAQLLALCIAAVLLTTCSKSSTRSPTGPTPQTTPPRVARHSRGLIGPSSAGFPPRNEPYDFRQQLEAKYRDSLHRTTTPTYVDLEGDIVWTTEYLRYRVSGCAHSDAVQKVFSQIDGGGIAADCGQQPSGEVAFPPRNEPFAFRQELETKYRQGLGRQATATYVDVEGDIVWTQEYLRYRVNYCGHADSVAKVFSQIDGGGIAPTCYTVQTVPPPPPPPPPACSYAWSGGPGSVPQAGGQFSFTFTRTSGDCGWTASSSAPWLTLASTSGSGSGVVTLPITLSANPDSAPRSGYVTFTWTQGSATAGLTQLGTRADCAKTITVDIPAAGWGGYVNVGYGCSPLGYSAPMSIDVDWITFRSTHGGGTYIELLVSANSGTARTGHVSFGNILTITINQAAGNCVTSISPVTASFPYIGGTGTIAVTALAGCPWQAQTNVRGLTINAGSGSGNGTVAYTLAANTDTLTNGGRIFVGQPSCHVSQDACPLSISPRSVTIPAAGGTFSVQVSGGAICVWAVAAGDFITASDEGHTRTGPGTTTFTVAPNTTGRPRNGVVAVATGTVDVLQTAS